MAVRKETQADIRKTLRNECGLQLRKPDSPPNRPSYIHIPVKILPGCPHGFENLEIEVSKEVVEEALLFADYRDNLEKIASGAPGILGLHSKLTSEKRPGSVDLPTPTQDEIERIGNWARALLARLNQTAEIITRRILLVDEDPMGTYCYSKPNPKSAPAEPPSPRIELYWAVIGLLAKLRGWNVGDLAIKVFTHELAHAFTQLGFDIDGKDWPREKFAKAEKFVKEGLAQYYTHRTLEHLASKDKRRYGGAFRVYEKLWPKQPAAYRVHRAWIESPEPKPQGENPTPRYSPEVVRHAMLGLRRSDETTLRQFERRLSHAKNDLRPKEPHPRRMPPRLGTRSETGQH